jgi:hypothetical protein
VNRALQLAVLQTVLFVSVVFFFYVAAFGVRSLLGDDTPDMTRVTHVFWVASLIAMASTVQVLLRSGRVLYSRVAVGSSVLAAIAVILQGVTPFLALMPIANAVAILGFERQRQRA